MNNWNVDGLYYRLLERNNRGLGEILMCPIGLSSSLDEVLCERMEPMLHIEKSSKICSGF